MLTEILIKPFIEDLERQGIEDTTPYEQGFLAGMTALSSILSENIDNKAQLFTYLGMAISEGMQWVESQVSERNDVAPIFAEKFPATDDPRWINPNSSYLGWMCYGISFEGEFIKGKLNIAIAGNFILETDRVFGNGVSKIIPLEDMGTPRERQPTPSSDQMTKGQKMAKGIIGLLVSNFTHFDRVDDEGFTVEDFRNFFKSKEFTIDMCTDFFRQALTEATKDLL